MQLKRKLFALSAAVVLVVPLVGFGNPMPARAATTITDCTGLANISLDLTADYTLGNDINCSGVADWTPLGNFTGKLDGAGFSIQHLTIAGYDNESGLFSSLDGARIYNLSITGADVQAGNLGGILAATSNNQTRLVNVHVDGGIESDDSVIGGIIGYSVHTYIYYSNAVVNVAGVQSVGGLVGASEGGSIISNSYSLGIVTASAGTAGGLAGSNYDSAITDSYSLSSVVVGASGVGGGLVGMNSASASIVNSYSTGGVTGSVTDVGGLVGIQLTGATTERGFWDTDNSGLLTSAAGEGKTTIQMGSLGTYGGWNLASIWSFIPGNYPTLIAYNNTAPVLTLAEQIPGSVSAGSSPIFKFTSSVISSPELIDLVVTSCGGSSSPLAEQLNATGDPVGIQISGLEAGHTYTCETYIRNLTETESNHLTIGPFSVPSGTTYGSRAKKKDASTPTANALPQIPNQQTPAVTPEQQIALPALGINSLLTRNLYFGLTGSDVKALQQYLNANGFKLAETGPGSPGNETEVFGPLTRAAVIRFQKAKGISPSVGYVGPITRKVISGS